jgi:hypothetical protein
MSGDSSFEANKKKKSVSDEDEDTQERVLSPLIVHFLLHYFKNDEVISACRDSIDAQVFESIYDMVIEVGRAGAGTRERSQLWNTEGFIELLRAFFATARPWLYVIKAVPLWYYKDPAWWLREYMNAPTPRARAELGLPYGVMDETKCYIKEVTQGMHTSYQVVPYQDKKKRGQRIEYTLFNHRLEFIDVDIRVKQEAEARLKVLHPDTKKRIETMMNFPHMAMPSTPWFAMAMQAKLLARAEYGLHKANWNRANPPMILISQPPPTLPSPDQLAEDMLLSDGTVEESQVAMKQRISRMFREYAQSNIRRVQEKAKGEFARPARHVPLGMTLRQADKSDYEYDEPIDDAFLFDDFVRVAKAADPDVIIDMTSLKKVYHETIKQQMMLPNDIFATDRALSYRSKQATQATLFSNTLANQQADPMNQRARQEQRIYQRLFAHVGTAPFDLYHMDKIEKMVADKDKAVDTLLSRVRVVLAQYFPNHNDKTVIYRETPEVILDNIEQMLRERAPMAAPRKRKTSEDMDVEDEGDPSGLTEMEIFSIFRDSLRLVNSTKVSAAGLRQYLMELQSHNPLTQTTARLAFVHSAEYEEAMEELRKDIKAEREDKGPVKKKPKKS